MISVKFALFSSGCNIDFMFFSFGHRVSLVFCLLRPLIPTLNALKQGEQALLFLTIYVTVHVNKNTLWNLSFATSFGISKIFSVITGMQNYVFSVWAARKLCSLSIDWDLLWSILKYHHGLLGFIYLFIFQMKYCLQKLTVVPVATL